jgi:hypothetical protein
MHWWSIRAAKEDLKAERISSGTLLPYLLCFLVGESAVVEFSFIFPAESEPAMSQYVFAFASVFLSGLGVWYVYWKNGGRAGRYFLERFLLLGWVTGVRFAVVTFFIFIGWIGLSIYSALPEETSDFALNTLVVLCVPAYYGYVGHHVRSLSLRDRQGDIGAV